MPSERSTSHLVNWSSAKITTASIAMRKFELRKMVLAAMNFSQHKLNTAKNNFRLHRAGNSYSPRMALVRILVDGYSLLHNWPELAEGAPRHSERARDELVEILTHYHDATGEPITIFFDGAGAPKNAPKSESSREVEVLFSRAGQTADDMIERAAHRFQEYGEVLVVT